MTRSLVLGAVLALSLTGCGSAARDITTPAKQSTELPCAATAAPQTLGSLDVNGDGSPDTITFEARAAGPGADCVRSDALRIRIAGQASYDLGFDDTLPVLPKSIREVSVPGRTGKLVLVVQTHPRGGFAAHLLVWDGSRMDDIGGVRGFVPFVATDAPQRYVTAACTADGFAVTDASEPRPVGVAASWDVHRTTYRTDGMRLSPGARTVVASGLSTDQLAAKYPGLVAFDLFTNCRS